ncbi:homeobox and leucine zipper protein Homez-like [Gadus chalcogrammus]|uniref:homeobox and leucine zipper protein Homez-like n=1 Tax=Gadus chalcogrammus TaxID=1042646 RepID=UPI0024C47E9F|nr:homeobox and leucine zipper protein Homez-like [Gadus chalcogrammus]
MVFEEESTSVSPVDIEGFTLQNKSPLSCPPCPPVSLSPCRVATPAGSPLPSLTQAQAFSLNKNSTLCLPVFSADNKLLWVHSNSIAQEVAHAADTLDGAFEVFPYPKREEMAKLARRCSLHLDHVRVWFMFQRLHYGISWDYADICAVRRRLLGPGRQRPAKAAVVVGGEDDPQAAVRTDDPGGCWARGADDRRVETPGRPCKRKLGEENEKGKTSARDKGDRARVRKGAKSTEEEDPPKRKDGEPGRVEGGMALLTNQEPVPESTASPTPSPVSSVRRPDRRHRKKKKTPFDLLPKVQVSEIPLASKGHRGPPGAGENHAGRKADSTATVSRDDDGVDGVAPGNGSAHGNTSALGDLGTSKAKASTPDAKPKNKTKEQLEQLRRAFLACQYPNPCDYDWLSEWTGLQRTRLIQWFGDTRYEIKNTEPRWITPGDQQRVLARMRQRQRMKHLCTGEAGAGREAASGPGAGTWRLKLEERSIPIPISTAPAPAH